MKARSTNSEVARLTGLRRGPDASDHLIGARVRQLRSECGVSSETLAGRLGVSIQQLQKYETGQNRIAASRLWAMSQALGQPIQAFYPPDAGAPVERVESDLSLVSRLRARYFAMVLALARHLLRTPP